MASDMAEKQHLLGVILMVRSRNLVFVVSLVVLVTSVSQALAEQQNFWYDQPAAVPRANTAPPGGTERPADSGLTSLVSRIGEIGREHFNEFFGLPLTGPSPIVVEPFVFISGSGQKRVTELGVLLADQMVAVLHNAVLARSPNEASGPLLRGTLQETDGKLRIHMVGIDSARQYRSLVITLDMSKAIFRSLHAY